VVRVALFLALFAGLVAVLPGRAGCLAPPSCDLLSGLLRNLWIARRHWRRSSDPGAPEEP
jgi:hypothetical protein